MKMHTRKSIQTNNFTSYKTNNFDFFITFFYRLISLSDNMESPSNKQYKKQMRAKNMEQPW